ncbi:Tetratricopeptide repeat protein 27 [Liparis tanakae]|uniref:Tetratricopeptide repeat protein 27 n=1 Tax=Liparis tanakae TaxID=230148 RepID=A0A4Z2E9E7_9TELE|nr:Tetratricopeptide repeat protein 27 [Liparis tanakae]
MPLAVEMPILRGFLTAGEETGWKQSVVNAAEAGPLLEALLQGDFEAVVLSPLVVALLSGDGRCSEGDDIEAYLEERVLLYLDGDQGDR